MSLHFNDFAAQPILTYVHTPSPGYLRKAIDLGNNTLMAA